MASNASADSGVASPAHPACVYVIDSNIPKSDLGSLASAITNALHALPKNTYIGLITFGHCIKFTRLGCMAWFHATHTRAILPWTKRL